MEWKETARWIKFEENVEDSNRWGKPHVASLTFHSLLELRKGLEKGMCFVKIVVEQESLKGYCRRILSLNLTALAIISLCSLYACNFFLIKTFLLLIDSLCYIQTRITLN